MSFDVYEKIRALANTLDAAPVETPAEDALHACVAALANVVVQQEQRLRALEPCTKARGGRPGPHVWTGFQGEPGARCGYCEVPRGNAP